MRRDVTTCAQALALSCHQWHVKREDAALAELALHPHIPFVECCETLGQAET